MATKERHFKTDAAKKSTKKQQVETTAPAGGTTGLGKVQIAPDYPVDVVNPAPILAKRKKELDSGKEFSE